MADPLLGRSIRELGRLLRSAGTTPTHLARAAIEGLDGEGRALNAVAAIDAERAMREAEKAEAELGAGVDRGPLHGIPWGAKDLLATRGVPTTWGAAPLTSQVFAYDATVVQRLEVAGAVLIGKLAMIELAGGAGYDTLDAAWTGPARNPWRPDAWAGGSSSGSGAAVGARLLPFTIGSETMGSILGPAAYCGVTGLRPTYGRVSRHGAMALAWTMDKLGPLARSADDCALVLTAIAGSDARDPTASARAFRHTRLGSRSERCRFAVPAGWQEGIDDTVAANVEASLDILRGMGTVDTIEFPDYPYVQAARIIIASEGASAFSDLIEDGRIAGLSSWASRVRPYAYSVIPAADYLRAMRVRRKIAAAMDRLFADFDALIGPTVDNVAHSLEGTRDLRFRPGKAPAVDAAANLTGLPAISVPNGFGAGGLPTGLRLTGRAWSESRLLAIAEAFQLRTDFHVRAPSSAVEPSIGRRGGCDLIQSE